MKADPESAGRFTHSNRQRAARWAPAFLAAVFCLNSHSQLAARSPAEAADVAGQATHSLANPAVSAVATAPGAWVRVPRVTGRLGARELGVVINTADPYSVAVGEFYVKTRRIAPDQVLRVTLPVKATLDADEFKAFEARVQAFFKPNVQALALAWTLPYAVNCNSITGALALGYDATLCAHTCAASRPSPYFNAATVRPFAELKLRPSMLLAAPNVAAARALILRGAAADRSLGQRGAPPVNAYFLTTSDAARNVRARLFPPAGELKRIGVDIHVESLDAVRHPQRAVLYLTGLPRVDGIADIHWVPGALADHLTSYGGQLQLPANGQMSAMDWIAAGATASYGTVSEPCSHVQKFPHPQILLLHYLQGSTALEAYWKSVAWPQQGVFIGDPLAAPFARR